ncbi:permease [Geotalea daltonii]|nr:permease [Geotalea daltonii]
MFIGFVESGVPLGVTLSFLISSPMVNEVALIILWGMFGWKVALVYIGTGLLVAIFAGMIIGRLKMEKYVQDYVWEMQVGNTEIAEQRWSERFANAHQYTAGLLKKIWPFVVVGIGIGAFIHGYVPQYFLARWAGRNNPFAVPVAVALGVPLYSNAAGVIPIVQALTAKGMAIGTVLTFMMAVTALSLPEAIILSNVLKKPLLATFFGVVATAIVAVGYLFNAISLKTFTGGKDESRSAGNRLCKVQDPLREYKEGTGRKRDNCRSSKG